MYRTLSLTMLNCQLLVQCGCTCKALNTMGLQWLPRCDTYHISIMDQTQWSALVGMLECGDYPQPQILACGQLIDTEDCPGSSHNMGSGLW